MSRLITAVGLVLVMFGASEVSAQKSVVVRFEKGANSAIKNGTITGYKYIDYLYTANEGQIITADVSADSRFTNFVIFDPKMENLDGATNRVEFKGSLPQTGEYRIRVLMNRNEARRKGSKSNFKLSVKIE